MPFRSDDEIRRLADEAMRELGEPRCLFITGVLPLAGLDYHDAATRDEYVAKLFPFDDPATARNYAATAYSCGITTEVGWRYAGVDWPVLWDAYLKRVNRGQQAVVEERKIALKTGAWVDTVHWKEGMPLPLPGDAPIIGCSSCGDGWGRGTYSGEHEYTMLAYDPAGDGIFHSLDGGQPGIAFRTRAHVQVFTGHDSDGRRTGELWVAAVNDKGKPMIAGDGYPSVGRRMVGYTSVPGLPRTKAEGPCLTSEGDTVGGWLDSRALKIGSGVALGLGALWLARRQGYLRRFGVAPLPHKGSPVTSRSPAGRTRASTTATDRGQSRAERPRGRPARRPASPSPGALSPRLPGELLRPAL